MKLFQGIFQREFTKKYFGKTQIFYLEFSLQVIKICAV